MYSIPCICMTEESNRSLKALVEEKPKPAIHGDTMKSGVADPIWRENLVPAPIERRHEKRNIKKIKH